MEYLRLDEVCELNMGQSPASDSYNREADGLPFFQGNADFGETYPVTRVWCNKPTKIVDKGTLLISVRAPIGALNFATEKSCIGRGLAGITQKNGYELKYIYYALKFKHEELNNKGTGSTFKAISKASLGEILIKNVSVEIQEECVKKLDLINKIIVEEREQIKQLDALIKSRFVEMFGDPVQDKKCFNVLPMTEICEIIDGDRGENYPKQDEFLSDGYCLFLNAKNVTISGFSFSNCMFITKEKDAILRNGRLNRGDVVLTTRGTIGNLAYYDASIPYDNIRINSGMVILRMKSEIVGEVFFIEQFKMQLEFIKRKIASGSAQPQLPISTMNKIKMLIPPMELQKQFAAFVRQIDKLKFIY